MRKKLIPLVVVLSLIVALMAACAPAKEEPAAVVEEVKAPVLSGEIAIGYIAASPGHVENTLPSVKIAIEDVNKYAESLGRGVTFELYPENAESEATKALECAQTLYARGVKFIVGSNWSSQCKACLDYANENKIVMVSDGSTSPALAIADDYLFRLPATDETQTQALAVGVLREIGIDGLVVLQRADAWGDGNAEFIETNFTAVGGEIAGKVRYSSEKTEFSAEIKELDEVVSEALDKYGEGKVAIAIWSFDEIAVIASEAANYSTLMQVPWIGSNGITRSTRLTEEAIDAAKQMKILSMMIGVSRSEKYDAFREKYMQVVDQEPGAYTTFAYDAVWILAKSILEVGEYNSEKVQAILPTIAGDYFGAGGWFKLNQYGDRGGATFEIWTVVVEAGTPVWKPAATFDMATGSTTWSLRPEWLTL